MEPRTLNQLLSAAAERHRKEAALMTKEGGVWRNVSSKEWLETARDLAVGLATRGVKRGDRVAFLSENRLEWFTLEAALQILGAVTVPIYPTVTAAAVRYIVENSGARVVVASDAGQQAKIVEIKDALSQVDLFVSLDEPVAGFGGGRLPAIAAVGNEQRKKDPEAAARLAAAVGPDDVATIIYTSGTTGNPKGVMLTQSNLVQNVLVSSEALALRSDDLAISVLPYSHVFARMVAHYLYPHVGVTVAIAENMDRLVENIGEVKPTLMACVPRFYEKMRDRVNENAAAGSPLKQRIFRWAFRIGHAVGKHRQDGTAPPAWLRLRYGVATRLVFSKLHARLGGRMRLFVSGGAALPRDVAEFFLAAGWVVVEGYGLTETSPVITVNRLDRFRFGTVGLPVRGVEVRIADDGEILCRGHNVMKGYFGNEDATRSAIDGDGWFHTGDIGEFDGDGFLRITDRKKDLLVTAGGKNVAPQPIEGRLKGNRYIAEIVMVGDGRPYVSALVAPDFDQLRRWCAGEGLPADSPETMAGHERVRDFLQAEIDAMSGDLARFERIKRIAVLATTFSIETGELTPTLKVKRPVIAKRYADLIEALYA